MLKKQHHVSLSDTDIDQIRGAIYVTAYIQPSFAKKTEALDKKLGKMQQ